MRKSKDWKMFTASNTWSRNRWPSFPTWWGEVQWAYSSCFEYTILPHVQIHTVLITINTTQIIIHINCWRDLQQKKSVSESTCKFAALKIKYTWDWEKFDHCIVSGACLCISNTIMFCSGFLLFCIDWEGTQNVTFSTPLSTNVERCPHIPEASHARSHKRL